MLTASLPVRHVSEFSADVRESLTKTGQRELPSKYLYDEVGSALFETICVLPEYGLTRADARLLEKYAREIVGAATVADSGGGARQRHRKKDSLDSGSAVAAAKDVVLPHRDFALGAGGVGERTRADRYGQHRGIRAAVPGGVA